MFKIFIIVVAGILVGGFVLKYWKEILSTLLVLLFFLISAILYIITLPVQLFASLISDEKIEELIVKEYDWMFFEADTIKDIKKRHYKLKRVENILNQRRVTALYKEGRKILEDSKYVL